MKIIKISYIVLVIVLFNSIILSQSQVAEKKKQLSKLKSEIKELKQKIDEFNKIEKKSLDDIQKYNIQTNQLRKLIKQLVDEENNKIGQIAALELSIAETEKTIKELKTNYASYIRWLYKNGKNIDLVLLLNAESINNTILRYKYLNKITEQKKKDLIKLSEQLVQLKELKVQLTNEKEEKAEIKRLKEQEEKRLRIELNNQKKLLADLRRDKNNILKQLHLKQQSHNKIQELINSLPDENIVVNKPGNKKVDKTQNNTKKKEVKNNQTSRTDNNVIVENTAPKNNFISPVRGSVYRNFGSIYNAKLNTTTVNYGIDIKVSENTPVVAASDGRVSRIETLPGYGNIIIISHNNGIRSVYGHIANINVVEGQYVRQGQKIGVVDESLEGYILHFEIWERKNCINPTPYLSLR